MGTSVQAGDPGRHDVILDVALRRARRLVVSDPARSRAAEVVKACGYKFLAEPRLYDEWRSDLAASTKHDEVARAMRGPDAHYLAWLSTRVAEPFAVSPRAVRNVAASVGQENANLLVHVRWRQELAWAHRLRTSDDDVVSVVAAIFLTRAQMNASEEFKGMAETWLGAVEDRTYVMAPEHDYDDLAIRGGYGDGSFEPLFLRRGRVAYADRIGRMSAKDLREVAGMHRRTEADEASKAAGVQAATHAASRAPMARLVGVIQVAREVGMDSDSLVDAERTYLGLLMDYKVKVPLGTGHPYREFMAWLRTSRRTGAESRTGADELASEMDLCALKASSRRWLDSLPPDYRAMGAGERHCFQEWSGPILRGLRPPPLDVVSDYGFFLVDRALVQ